MKNRNLKNWMLVLERHVYNKGMTFKKVAIIFFLVFDLFSCESFLDIEPPKDTLITETVFEDISTVESAMANIYYKIREEGMVSGNFGLSIDMGIYADELDYYGFDTGQLNFFNHNISAGDPTVFNWWSSAYNLIYAANDIIEGLDNSKSLSPDDIANYKGQALFIRAYLYSLLVGVFGDIPYIITTNYVDNNTTSRMETPLVYESIIKDLNQSITFLNASDETGERILPNMSVVQALLARMYLYVENWEMAEVTSNLLINKYSLEMDMTKVFLKDSQETLWQLKPGKIANTYEAGWLIVNHVPTQGYVLSNSLLSAFEPGDLRRSNWVGSITSNDGQTTLYYPYKYKETINTTTSSLEYSIVFRLTEQYLIRSEARVHLENLSGGESDLNRIRSRAGLDPVNINSKEGLLEAITKERRVELFTEHGQRWFDLKRLELADEVLSPVKVNWNPSHVLLPIPENEIDVNPNLKPQNAGY